MSAVSNEPRGLKLVPVWLPVAVVLVTALSNVGAVSATYGNRISEAEKRLDAIERDRDLEHREYEEFKADIRSQLIEIKTDVGWIRKSMEHGASGP